MGRIKRRKRSRKKERKKQRGRQEVWKRKGIRTEGKKK